MFQICIKLGISSVVEWDIRWDPILNSYGLQLQKAFIHYILDEASYCRLVKPAPRKCHQGNSLPLPYHFLTLLTLFYMLCWGKTFDSCQHGLKGLQLGDVFCVCLSTCTTPLLFETHGLDGVFTCLPAHISVFDIFLLPWCLPLFLLSAVKSQSSVLYSCVSGGSTKVTENALLGIRGLKMRNYSNADYCVWKKCLCSIWNDENK